MPIFKVEIERTKCATVYVEAPSAQLIRRSNLIDEAQDFLCHYDWDDTYSCIANTKEIDETEGFSTDFTVDENGEIFWD